MHPHLSEESPCCISHSASQQKIGELCPDRTGFVCSLRFENSIDQDCRNEEPEERCTGSDLEMRELLDFSHMDQSGSQNAFTVSDSTHITNYSRSKKTGMEQTLFQDRTTCPEIHCSFHHQNNKSGLYGEICFTSKNVFNQVQSKTRVNNRRGKTDTLNSTALSEMIHQPEADYIINDENPSNQSGKVLQTADVLPYWCLEQPLFHAAAEWDDASLNIQGIDVCKNHLIERHDSTQVQKNFGPSVQSYKADNGEDRIAHRSHIQVGHNKATVPLQVPRHIGRNTRNQHSIAVQSSVKRGDSVPAKEERRFNSKNHENMNFLRLSESTSDSSSLSRIEACSIPCFSSTTPQNPAFHLRNDEREEIFTSKDATEQERACVPSGILSAHDEPWEDANFNNCNEERHTEDCQNILSTNLYFPKGHNLEMKEPECQATTNPQPYFDKDTRFEKTHQTWEGMENKLFSTFSRDSRSCCGSFQGPFYGSIHQNLSTYGNSPSSALQKEEQMKPSLVNNKMHLSQVVKECNAHQRRDLNMLQMPHIRKNSRLYKPADPKNVSRLGPHVVDYRSTYRATGKRKIFYSSKPINNYTEKRPPATEDDVQQNSFSDPEIGQNRGSVKATLKKGRLSNKIYRGANFSHYNGNMNFAENIVHSPLKPSIRHLHHRNDDLDFTDEDGKYTNTAVDINTKNLSSHSSDAPISTEEFQKIVSSWDDNISGPAQQNWRENNTIFPEPQDNMDCERNLADSDAFSTFDLDFLLLNGGRRNDIQRLRKNGEIVPVELVRNGVPLRHAYTCNICNEHFGDGRSLDNHKLLKHRNTGKPRIKCPQCPKTMISSANVQRHVSICHASDKFKCPYCPVTFATARSLTEHIRNDHKVRRNAKGQPLPSKDIMQDQIVYPCDECEKTFKTKRNFTRHFDVVHRNVKNFKCAVCSKQFTTKSNMRVHMKVHEENC